MTGLELAAMCGAVAVGREAARLGLPVAEIVAGYFISIAFVASGVGQ